jgi:hypothetical protein
LKVRGVEEKKKRRKTRFYNFGKAYFSSWSSIITPLPLVQRRIEMLKLALP